MRFKKCMYKKNHVFLTYELLKTIFIKLINKHGGCFDQTRRCGNLTKCTFNKSVKEAG